MLSMCAWNMRSRPTDAVLHLLGDGMDGLSQAATEAARNKMERVGGALRWKSSGWDEKEEQSGAQEAAGGKIKGTKGV